jgi:hypothetical protein
MRVVKCIHRVSFLDAGLLKSTLLMVVLTIDTYSLIISVSMVLTG